MTATEDEDPRYSKHVGNSAGELDDCWEVRSHRGEDEEVIAYVDTEYLADVLLADLTCRKGPFEEAQRY